MRVDGVKQTSAVQYSPVVVDLTMKVPLIVVTVRGDRNRNGRTGATLVAQHAESNQNGLLPSSMVKTTESVSKGYMVVREIDNLCTVKVTQ